MKEFKEKPKLGKAKEKPTSAFLPRQAAHMMKEKYIREMDQQPTGTGSDAKQAPDQVEQAGRWAAGEQTGRAVEQGQKYAKKQFAAARGEAQTVPNPVPRGAEGPSAEGTPRGRSAPEYPAAASEKAEHFPTAPKKSPQTKYTVNPIKERQMVERPSAQAVKERTTVDMPRNAARDTAPRTAAGQASLGNHSETVPFKLRQRKAVRERPIADTSRIAAKQMPAAPGKSSEKLYQ